MRLWAAVAALVAAVVSEVGAADSSNGTNGTRETFRFEAALLTSDPQTFAEDSLAVDGVAAGVAKYFETPASWVTVSLSLVATSSTTTTTSTTTGTITTLTSTATSATRTSTSTTTSTPASPRVLPLSSRAFGGGRRLAGAANLGEVLAEVELAVPFSAPANVSAGLSLAISTVNVTELEAEICSEVNARILATGRSPYVINMLSLAVPGPGPQPPRTPSEKDFFQNIGEKVVEWTEDVHDWLVDRTAGELVGVSFAAVIACACCCSAITVCLWFCCKACCRCCRQCCRPCYRCCCCCCRLGRKVDAKSAGDDDSGAGLSLKAEQDVERPAEQQPRDPCQLREAATAPQARIVVQGAVCFKGHTLKAFPTPDDTWWCSKCKKLFPEGTTFMGCRACDYDLCKGCADRKAAAPQAQLSAPPLGTLDLPGAVPSGESGTGAGDAPPAPTEEAPAAEETRAAAKAEKLPAADEAAEAKEFPAAAEELPPPAEELPAPAEELTATELPAAAGAAALGAAAAGEEVPAATATAGEAAGAAEEPSPAGDAVPATAALEAGCRSPASDSTANPADDAALLGEEAAAPLPDRPLAQVRPFIAPTHVSMALDPTPAFASEFSEESTGHWMPSEDADAGTPRDGLPETATNIAPAPVVAEAASEPPPAAPVAQPAAAARSAAAAAPPRATLAASAVLTAVPQKEVSAAGGAAVLVPAAPLPRPPHEEPVPEFMDFPDLPLDEELDEEFC